MATLVGRYPHVNDLDEFFDPYRCLFKDMSELNLFTILVAINSPSLFDTSLLFFFCDFLNLVNKGQISKTDMGFICCVTSLVVNVHGSDG